MDLSRYLTFVVIVIITTLSPGPAVLLAITNGALHGPRLAAIAILGNVMALMLMATISALGLGAVLLASTTLFTLLKWIGGLYLIYLGIKIWRSKTLVFDAGIASRSAITGTPASLFKQAFFVATSNPKAIAFFTALFPQFIAPDDSLAPQLLLLAGTFGFFSFLFLMGYAILSNRARYWLSRPRYSKLFQRCSGTAFIGIGVGMIATQRQ